MEAHSLFDKLSSHDLVALAGIGVGVIAILGGFTVAIVKVVSSNRRRSQLDDIEATLKLEMIQQGMSAADIKQVLEARVPGNQSIVQDMMNHHREHFAGHGGWRKACGKT